MKGGGKARNDAGYQSSSSTGKGLLVTDELINHARHIADSASVTAQLRPHSFNHLTARTNTFQARFCLCRHGNITTHMLVHLPRAKTGSVWHLSGFAFLLAVHTLVFSWTWRNFLGLNYFFFSQFSQSIGHVSGLMAGSSEIVHMQTSRHSTSAKVFWFPFMHPLLSFSFNYHLFDIFTLWRSIIVL